MSGLARQLAAILAGGAALLALALGVTDEPLLYFASLVLIWAIFAIGFDLVFGLTGLLSFGHAAFFGVGAYVQALLTLDMGWAFAPAFGAALLAGAGLAALFGMFAIRMSGVYLALTTLALAQLVNILVEVKLRGLTGGSDGLIGVPRPEAFGLDFYDSGIYLAFLAILFTIALAAAAILRRSPFGQVLQAIRQNEVRADQLGFDVRGSKIAVFAVSGLFAAAAGALMGGLTSFVGPDMTGWKVSGDVLIMTILGGRGTLLGPVLGVLAFELLRDVASAWTDHWYGILGIVFIAFTLFLPEGLMGGMRTLRRAWRTAGRGRPATGGDAP
ncbi:MAG: branched-chain amino acid ABC transporter permease [Sneathiellaceae bacterium]